MPVFSSTLKTTEGDEKTRLTALENHIRAMQEQLEYTLLHLDESNFAELTVDGGEW